MIVSPYTEEPVCSGHFCVMFVDEFMEVSNDLDIESLEMIKDYIEELISEIEE